VSQLSNRRPSLPAAGLAWAALLLLVSAAPFKVGMTSLEALTRRSELIVVGRVTGVEDMASGGRVATATVEQTWKGEELPQVHYRAEAVHMCDITSARPGERVLLFLTAPMDDGRRAILHAGYGRMPILSLQGEPYATVGGVVKLPKRTPTIPRASGGKAVPLAVLEELVAESVRKQLDEETDHQAAER
jgi:hypothetical protein